MKGYICDLCGGYAGDGPYYADDIDDDNEYCYSCCPADFHGNPYDDEAGRGYAETTKGEERAEAWPAAWKANAQAADARRGPVGR